MELCMNIRSNFQSIVIMIVITGYFFYVLHNMLVTHLSMKLRKLRKRVLRSLFENYLILLLVCLMCSSSM